MNALNSPTSHQYVNTLAHFIPHIIRLDQLLDQAIQAQDQDALLGLSKIICGMGDNHCRLVLSKINQGGMNIIQMILKIAKMPLQYPTEESCSPVSFTFWYSLQGIKLNQIFKKKFNYFFKYCLNKNQSLGAVHEFAQIHVDKFKD